MIDYLIVGAGLAGISFADLALNNNKKVVVFNQKLHSNTLTK